MEFIKFIFSSFWTFTGFFLILCAAATVVKSVFDFVVELAHGKPIVQNVILKKEEEIKNTEELKKLAKKEPEHAYRVGGKATATADVKVHKNK